MYQKMTCQKVSQNTRSVKHSFLISFFLMLLYSSVSATELNANLFSTTEYTSNSRLANKDTEEDVIERVGINVVFTEERKRFNADASFNLTQEFYLNNTFSDQTQLTTGFGLFNFDIVEDFLDWRTSFTRAQVLSDSSAGDTPDNREERDTFRTGPTMNYRINQASTFRFGANYVQVENSGDDAADTKRIDANASYIYQYNSITSLSLNGNYDRVIEITEDGQTRSGSDEHTQNIAFNIGLNRQFSHGALNAQVGRNEVRSENNETVSGNFFNIELQREQLLFHDVVVQYSESISDSSIGFESFEALIEANPNLSPTNPIPETTSQLDIIKQKSARVSVDRSIDSYQYNLDAFWSEQDYRIQLNDERSIGFTIGMRQQIQEGLTLGFAYQQVKQKLLDTPDDGNNFTQTYTLDCSNRWTEDFSTNGFIAYEKRTNNKVSTSEYEEVSVGVTFSVDIY